MDTPDIPQSVESIEGLGRWRPVARVTLQGAGRAAALGDSRAASGTLNAAGVG